MVWINILMSFKQTQKYNVLGWHEYCYNQTHKVLQLLLLFQNKTLFQDYTFALVLCAFKTW